MGYNHETYKLLTSVLSMLAGLTAYFVSNSHQNCIHILFPKAYTQYFSDRESLMSVRLRMATRLSSVERRAV